VVSGPGNFAASGSGSSASFTPTNCGVGSITFYLTYTKNTPCDTNVYSASSNSLNFSSVAVADLTPDVLSGQGGLETGSAPQTYWVCPCAGDMIVTASSCPSLTADQLPDCWTFTGGVEIDKLHHKVKKSDLKN
jgi:hypothetical protein